MNKIINIDDLKIGDRIIRKQCWLKKILKIYDYHIYTVAKDDEGEMWLKDWRGGWSMKFDWFKPDPKNPLDTYNRIEDFELV